MLPRAIFALLLLLGPAAARAEPEGPEMVPVRRTSIPVHEAAEEVRAKEDETPAVMRWMLAPLQRGMFVRLPTIDTDPNRGITWGVMPIWVLQGKTNDNIQQIHAPSLTYNKDFGLTPTYRYYYYPADDASFSGRVSRGRYEHEVFMQYDDRSLLGTSHDFMARFQKNRDASQRFYGLGPDAPRSADANFIEDYWQANWAVGHPLSEGSPWRVRLSERYIDSRILDGPLRGLPLFDQAFPQQFSVRSQQTNESRVSLDYDTRDHTVTTSRGAYLDTYVEASVRGYLSMYDYERYGWDVRWFEPAPNFPSQVIAVQGRYEQIIGPTPPFWLLPSMGGKYSLRAYGDGRYVDRGGATVNIEDRIKLSEAKTAGVTTEFQFAPFIGVGAVFDTPENAATRSLRPVVGAALRAVARPQVVGSVDFGIGREGLAVFTDINYSF
ncbi:MAG: BamA/TamA family outer membrane protein [Elusimicrobiota bacterium]